MKITRRKTIAGMGFGFVREFIDLRHCWREGGRRELSAY
jgi:hypothetical protein